MARSYSRLLDLGGQAGGAAVVSARPSCHLTLAHKTKSNSYRSLLSFSPPSNAIQFDTSYYEKMESLDYIKSAEQVTRAWKDTVCYAEGEL